MWVWEGVPQWKVVSRWFFFKECFLDSVSVRKSSSVQSCKSLILLLNQSRCNASDDLRKECFLGNVSVNTHVHEKEFFGANRESWIKKTHVRSISPRCKLCWSKEGFLAAAMRDRSDRCRRGLEKGKEGGAPERESFFVTHIIHSWYISTFNKLHLTT